MSAPLPKLKRDWVGRKVRTRYELANGDVIIPAGAVLTVRHNGGARQQGGGLTLVAPPCECCHVRVFITHVRERDVDLLPVEES